MVSSSQIREQMAMLLDKKIDLDSFEDWLVQNTWNIHLSGSVAAESLTFAIEESLSEYSSGHQSEKKLREELDALIGRDNKVLIFRSAPSPAFQAVRDRPAFVLVSSLLRGGYESIRHCLPSRQPNIVRPLSIQ